MDENFRVVETFGWHPGEGARRIERHLARMERTARELRIPWRPGGASHLLERIERYADAPDAYAGAPTGGEVLRCRLTLDRNGAFDLTAVPLGVDTEEWRVDIATERLCSDDHWLRMKTTNRALYNHARANMPRGLDERLFLNEHGRLCEGTISNLFVDLGEGLLTPPLSDGLLPGVLREEMLETGKVREARLVPDDLAGASAIHMGNSVRGLIRARLVRQ